MSKEFQRVLKLPELPGPLYKDSINRFYTNQLFIDKIEGSGYQFKYRPPFSLHDQREGFICAKDTFVAVGDPTGYLWALKYLKSWDHWLRLMKSGWFQNAYEYWVGELHMKMKSEAIMRIQDISENAANDGQRLAASKYLAERAYENKRGRPSKTEVRGELKRLAELDQDTQDEFKRVKGLMVIDGDKGKTKSAS